MHGHVILEMEGIFEMRLKADQVWQRCLRTLFVGQAADSFSVNQVCAR